MIVRQSDLRIIRRIGCSNCAGVRASVAVIVEAVMDFNNRRMDLAGCSMKLIDESIVGAGKARRWHE